MLHGFGNVWSHAAEEEASRHHEVTCLPQMQQAPPALPPLTIQLVPMISLHQWHSLKLMSSLKSCLPWYLSSKFSNNLFKTKKHVSIPTPVSAPAPPLVEPVHEELAQGSTPNADNLSTVWRPASIAEELTSLSLSRIRCFGMTRKRKASSAATCLNRHYPASIHIIRPQ